MKDNTPDNNIVGSNIYLIPEDAILKILQKLVFKDFNFLKNSCNLWNST